MIYQKFVEKDEYIDLLGYKSFIVLTGSMEPKIHVGDVVLIKKVAKDKIEQGDVITYSVGKSHTVTHRVVELVQKNGETFYQTKGDNNNASDSDLVKYEQILGTVCFRVPYLGKLLNKFTTTGGIAFVLLCILFGWSYSSKKTDRLLAREDARKRYNVCKYKKA